MSEPTDPVLGEALRRMTRAADRVAEVCMEVRNAPVPSLSEPRVADSSLMYFYATRPDASPELRAYAERVNLGECRWQDIDRECVPLPPEVLELKREPSLIWFTPAPPPLPEDDEPYTIEWQ